MPPTKKQTDRVKRWQSRTELANKQYKAWSEKFETQKLEQYYLGQQWPEEKKYSQNYVINLFYPSIETRKPALYFFNPRAKVEPKPTREDDVGSSLPARAKLREDLLNTLITDRKMKFCEETQLALHESHFGFGVVEVGYSADFIENPNVGKPMLNEKNDPLLDAGEPVIDTRKRIPEEEQIFVKRIPAIQFRVGVRGHNDLAKNDWCGYFDWHHVSDIKANKTYKNNKEIKATGELKRELWPESMRDEINKDETFRDMVLIWKVWDLRTNRKLIFAQGAESFLYEDTFKYLPFSTLKYHEILNRWYPLPPTYNWIKIQDELNETREMQRTHRKRSVRRFTYVTGAFPDGALDQLIEGGDMTIVECNQADPIQAVADAPLDPAIWRNVPATKDDFMEVSGVTGEQRGISEAETATQATIIDARTRMRETTSRKDVGKWLSNILWLMLQTVEDNMSLAFPIKVTVDPTAEGALEEAIETASVWKQMTADELGPLNYEVTVDLEELTPVTEESRRESWNQVLAILTNEKLLLLLMNSPTMLRKTMGFYGIRSEKELQEIQQVGNKLMQMLLGMEQQQAAGPKGSATDANTPAQINNQLAAQTGLLPQ